jgi:hypothetical protein
VLLGVVAGQMEARGTSEDRSQAYGGPDQNGLN